MILRREGSEWQYRRDGRARQGRGGFFRRQRSEQNRTAAHVFAHFFRHANGRPQAGQTFVGKSDFFMHRRSAFPG